jgi:hypothetical protein
VDDFLDKWHARCSIKRTIVLLKADTRRASDALHSTMKVKNFCYLAVNVVCIEHGI